MSRIGRLPINIPSGVTVEKSNSRVVVKGANGRLEMDISPKISVEVSQDKILVTRKDDQKLTRSLHGLTRSLIYNMIVGVSEGWFKKLQLVGVGYKALQTGDKLILSVGFSHPVEIQTPTGVTLEVFDNTNITVSGVDKQLVGQVAAKIRKIKPPEVYKGKGIRYEGEYIRRKQGKASKVGVGGK
ncbi:50S ribosomal protein L6 [Candidatus Daviesbacteria bacterium]|nr:50S ribosomal protein L6 [Candidatus Daviesbacteria bacterium]